ncbi:hypothetical protein Slin15195_G128550 [Septoria linicola]|uniref:Uncharacterized protein n=1 Tax=Septoria linicola TaxID=215465 RepID=A0A9Q9EQ77_9PEZI|nr:hypothetical protein Slin15195_G128550 [Septoria linicola]
MVAAIRIFESDGRSSRSRQHHSKEIHVRSEPLSGTGSLVTGTATAVLDPMAHNANDVRSYPMSAQPPTSTFNQVGKLSRFHAPIFHPTVMGTDPHCVVVVATIHLQHSFVQDEDLRGKSQEGFQKWLNFVRSASKTWPIVAAMADNLEAVNRSVTSCAQSNDAGEGGQRSWSVDSCLLARLLLYETAGQRNHEPDCSFRSATLIPKAGNLHDEKTLSAASNLMGSKGIHGHPSVPKDSVLTAPSCTDGTRWNDIADHNLFANVAPAANGLEELYKGRSLADFDSTGDGVNIHLPATGSNESLDNWFNSNLASLT